MYTLIVENENIDNKNIYNFTSSKELEAILVNLNVKALTGSLVLSSSNFIMFNNIDNQQIISFLDENDCYGSGDDHEKAFQLTKELQYSDIREGI